MSFDAFSQTWLPRIEQEMRALLENEPLSLRPMYGMMRYHLGWENRLGEPEDAPKGKRLRPLLTLMTAQAAGGDPAQALPAAAAVELIHNFSLIHDDIEDRSSTRRHRPTLWTWVGESQAINAGDAMFVLAHLALLRLRKRHLPASRILDAMQTLDDTCLRLTQGQFLDMDFETRTNVTLDEYMTMIAGKTAALIAASSALGAIIAGAADVASYQAFGHALGLSFQIEDDILGIWGEEAVTGKSATGDILTRKKTLPVLYALAQTEPEADALRTFYTRPAPLTPEDLPAILALLDALGARDFAEAQGRAYAEAALDALAATQGDPDAVAMLAGLVRKLVGRRW
ncbi:MAG TPA: polyprenyl synthetase family protein [Anaerolineae bacterium]|nr:polyprenyl synthetase family protein [Anaerolineae bacterium]